jgi:hypothetical protein
MLLVKSVSFGDLLRVLHGNRVKGAGLAKTLRGDLGGFV